MRGILVRRGLRRPELLIVDGGTGLESVIAAVWDSVPVQRCTATREEIETRRKAFIRKWSPTVWKKLATALHLHPSAAEPVAQRAYRQRHRTASRGVQAQDQDPDRAAIGRHCRHVVLGAAGFRRDQHAEGRWLANPRAKPIDQPIDLAA